MTPRTRADDRSELSADRGGAPIIGIVLLFGMVLAGAVLVFVAAGPLFDALEGQSERERAITYMGQTDQALATATISDGSQSLEVPPDAEMSAAEDGTLEVYWYNASAGHDPWDGPSSGSVALGTLEYELDDRTIAHQGGGIWERTGSQTSVEKPPQIGFESDGSLQLNFVQINSEASEDSLSSVQNNPERGMKAASDLTEIAGQPASNDFAIRVESEYAAGWEQHFEREANDADIDINVSRDGNEVIVEIPGFGDVPPGPHFLIEEDYGLTSPSEERSIVNNQIEQGDEFAINTSLTNYGDESSEVNATVSIWNDSTRIDSRPIRSEDQYATGETVQTAESDDWNRSLSFNTSALDLTPGHEYEYNIETDPGRDELDERGTFRVVDQVPVFAIEDVELDDPVKPRNPLEVEADIKNRGGHDEQLVRLEETDGSIVDIGELELNSSESKSVTFEWSSVDVPTPGNKTTVTVKTETNSTTETVEIDPLLELTDLEIAQKDAVEQEVSDSRTALLFDGDGDRVDSGVTSEALKLDESNGKGASEQQGNGQGAPEELTFSAWVKPTDDQTEDQVIWYGHNNQDNDGDNRWELVYNPDGEGSFGWRNYGSDSVHLNADVAAETGEWNFVTWTYDQKNETQKLYLNGQKAGEADNNDYSLTGGDQTMQLGSSADGSSSDFEGKMSGVALWNKALNENQIESVADERSGSGTIPGRQVLVWDMDEGSGDTLGDESKENNDGAIHGAEWVTGTKQPYLKYDVTVNATLESVGGDVEQEIALESGDQESDTTRDVDVTESSPETVSLSYETGENPTTHPVIVSTADDEMEEVVVIEREGPICEAISYDGSGTSADPYQIRTVDQLQCIDEHDLTADYELVDDIYAQGTEHWNGGAGFDPIGDQNHGGDEFSGDFNGNGNAIEGLYIDRPDEDFVGLFGINTYFDDSGPGVGEGSRIHDVRLKDVSVHGQQVTGGLIGAAGGVIENVRVSGTVTAEYQEVGGIVGSSHNADLDNRLVSEATVRGGVPAAASADVPHPWGADNMGIGGIVGSTGFNTEVSTAYSLADVEGPFAVGGIVGWTSDYASKNEQMYWAEGTIESTASQSEISSYLQSIGRQAHTSDNTGGAIFGRGDDDNDRFDASVYYNVDHHASPFGEHTQEGLHVNERATDEMQGLDVTEVGKLSELHYEEDGGDWVAIPDDYPRFAWELAAEGQFDVAINDVENATVGEAATVDVTVTSRYADSEESDVTQMITLMDTDGTPVDTQLVTLPSSLGESAETDISLTWQTSFGDDGVGEVTVHSEDQEDSSPIDIDDIDYNWLGGSDSARDDGLRADSDIDIEVDAVEIG